MVRTATILSTLILTALFVACGGGGNSETSTPTGTREATRTAAATQPAGGATAPVSSPTPWKLGPPFSADVMMSLSFPCTIGPSGFQVQLNGTYNGATVTLLLGGANSGTLLYDDPKSGVAVDLKSGSGAWYGSAGSSGATGTVNVGVNGGGSMQVTVPPFRPSPGNATDPVSVAGAWTCS
jgi:hypothetical protein